jgi:hypothetical protein
MKFASRSYRVRLANFISVLTKCHEFFQTSIPLADQEEAQAEGVAAACIPTLHSIPRGID